MRALNWFGLAAVALIIGCGGESSGKGDGDPPGEGEGGESQSTGGQGDAGESSGSGGTTGGKSNSTGGKTTGGGAVPGRGGGSSAGAPPMAGAGGAKPVPTGGAGGTSPEGCQLTQQFSGPSHCEESWTCENSSVYTACFDQGSGLWACDCKGTLAGYQYQVKGLNGISACSAISELCRAGEPPPEAGPEECTPTTSFRSTTACQLQEQCLIPLESEQGNVYRATGGMYLECGTTATNTSSCACQTSTQNTSFKIEGADGNTACDTLSDICRDADGLIDGEPMCTVAGQNVGPGYCSTQQQCTQSAEVASGVYATRNTFVQSDCSTASTGEGVQCNCYDQVRSAQFDLPTGTGSLADCTLAMDLCGGSDSLELEGPITCRQASQSAQAGYCNSQLDCVQSGTIGSTEVKVHGVLFTNCQMIGDAWSCTCQSGTVTDTINVESIGTPWDDCTAASEACQGAIDVQIGEGGGMVVPPRPPIPFK